MDLGVIWLQSCIGWSLPLVCITDNSGSICTGISYSVPFYLAYDIKWSVNFSTVGATYGAGTACHSRHQTFLMGLCCSIFSFLCFCSFIVTILFTYWCLFYIDLRDLWYCNPILVYSDFPMPFHFVDFWCNLHISTKCSNIRDSSNGSNIAQSNHRLYLEWNY